MSSFALTEHGNVASHVKFEQAARKEGIKPIFGVELYCGEIEEELRSQTKNHLTVLAENGEGYRNLLKLVSRSFEEGFYYEPTVSGNMLAAHSKGLVVLSGCQGSLLATSLVGGKGIDRDDAGYRRGKHVANRFRRALGSGYFLEVQAFPELEPTRHINEMVARISRELKIPMVATLDCHYTLPTEKEIQQVLHNVRGGHKKTLEEQARDWGYETDLCPPVTDTQVLRKLVATGLTKQEAINAILMTEEISQRCNVELPKLPMLRYPATDSYKLWRDWIKQGWKFRACDRLPVHERRAYSDRLKYEMGIIEEKDFVDYFLVVSDVVKFAKDRGIAVGPARGSAAASLVCWLLRITEVNPMLFDHLVFERFIDISRMDLPDIDLDFESDRRGEITDYLVSKYGRECVNNIGTFTTYKSKLALDDTARVYKIPQFKVEEIKSVLIERSSGDLRASATIEDTIEQFDVAAKVVDDHPEIWTATKLEGNVKGYGIHAAGLVVSTGPITDVCSVVTRVVNKEVRKVVNIDKYDAEYLGLLKLDFLALSTLDVLVDCCRMLGEDASFLYTIPLEDEEVIRGFQENDVVGIFQYDGRAVRSVNGALKPDTFQEVCDITALARPGPLHNGASNEYIDIKRGIVKPKLLHPAIEAITASTYYQIVYQEQILRIVREIGNFDWTHAAHIRKIISKKLGRQEFNREWERFWAGASSLHNRNPDMPPMEEEVAHRIWGMCITAGAYAFNAAHSVSYGTISWWTMWFKRHYPHIFFTASLRRVHSGGQAGAGGNVKASTVSKAKLDPQTIMLRDAVAHGIEPLPPNPEQSDVTWQRLENNQILAGFDEIPGVGETTASRMVEYRDTSMNGSFSWNDFLKIRGIGPVTINKIKDWVEQEDPFGIYTLDKLLHRVRAELPKLRLPLPTHTALEVPYERGQDTEIVWIGVPVHRNLRDIFESNRARTGIELDPSEVRNPELNEWMMVAGYDGTEIVTLRITRYNYPRFKEAVWGMRLHEDIVLARGVKPGWRTNREIYVSDMWVIEP
jgi:DNA polymerase-3 subunit alpha